MIMPDHDAIGRQSVLHKRHYVDPIYPDPLAGRRYHIYLVAAFSPHLEAVQCREDTQGVQQESSFSGVEHQPASHNELIGIRNSITQVFNFDLQGR